jgi:16S rRNA A1518/A1519 N6-dimethyltransferase RsmA/KsgA/DIM1 with predicted DNA glycosylase/AP lyase activity
MSAHKHVSPTQQSVDSYQPDFAIALQIANIMTEANQRLFRIQSEAANAAFAENSAHLKALLSTPDSVATLSEWTSLCQTNMRRAFDVADSCFEIVPQARAAIAELVGEPFVSANRETQQYLDQVTKAMVNGREMAAASAKEFLIKAVASANETLPTRTKIKVA